ncbi:hypothetical protein OL229_04420 [Neisseriaceae bacterium JH1-16]|nr:hypothetical protein [Neisseriaceae bacterium JH1-16]
MSKHVLLALLVAVSSTAAFAEKGDANGIIQHEQREAMKAAQMAKASQGQPQGQSSAQPSQAPQQ